MDQQSKHRLRKRKGLYFFCLGSWSQKISTSRPRKRRWRGKIGRLQGKKSDTERRSAEVAADRYTRAQPDAPDERETYRRLSVDVQVEVG